MLWCVLPEDMYLNCIYLPVKKDEFPTGGDSSVHECKLFTVVIFCCHLSASTTLLCCHETAYCTNFDDNFYLNKVVHSL